ncbi:MAG: tetratricopeptide repeat protein, partial [Chitinophagaceae bacterium]
MCRLNFVFVMFCIMVPFGFCAGQTPKINSLKKQLLSAGDDRQKVATLFALCEERNSLPTDTLYQYASLAKTLAEKNSTEKEVLLADYYLATALIKRGFLDSAMELVNNHFAAVQKEQYSQDLQTKYVYVKGHILIKSNRYKEAMEVFLSGLANAEKHHDTLAQVVSKNSIGWVYMELEQNRDALNWFHKAIRTTNNTAILEKYTPVFSNLAATYNSIGKNDSAEYFINRALAYARLQQNLQSLANSLAIQADIFIDTKRSNLAEASLNEALQIRKQVGEPY